MIMEDDDELYMPVTRRPRWMTRVEYESMERHHVICMALMNVEM